MLTPTEILDLAGTKSQGKRPQYLDTPNHDHLLSMVMTLAAELAVARERADTLERLLEERGVVTQGDVEGYIPDREAERQRQLKHMQFNARLFRSQKQHVEAMGRTEKTAEEMAETLKS